MANEALSALTATTALTSADLLYALDGANSRKITWANVLASQAAAAQTFTNKTIDANGTGNSITNIETADLASAAKTGSDTKVVTGTAGAANKVAMWNADGDLVEATETSLSDPGADRVLGWDDSETLTAFFTPANGVEISTTNLQATTNLRTDSIQFVIDGGGSAITTGVKGYLEIPFACTIQQVSLLADQSGSIVVDVWKDTYANYPPTNTESITASAVPTISTATKAQDATLTGWTTSITAGDILGFNVDSITTCERVTIALEVLKT